jgi:hypothetical protein
MQSISMRQQAFGKSTRTIYYLLVGFILLTILFSVYLGSQLRRSQRRALDAMELSTARIAMTNAIEVSASDIETPPNDIFSSGDVAKERAALQRASLKFHEAMKWARGDMHGDARLIRQLQDVDDAMVPVLRESENVFNLYSSGHLQRAGVAMASTNRSYARVRKELEDLKALIREQRLTDFHNQNERARLLDREQLVSAGLMALLVVPSASGP